MVLGRLAAAGSDLWVSDVTQRLLVLLRGADEPPVVVDWDDATSWSRRMVACSLQADGTGCWIIGYDGAFYAEPGGVVTRIADAVLEESVLLPDAVIGFEPSEVGMVPSTAHILDRSGKHLIVPLPGPVHGAAAFGDGAIVLVRVFEGDLVLPQLLRLTSAGDMISGPFLDEVQSGRGFHLVGAARVLLHNRETNRLHRVTDDLMLEDGLTIPKMYSTSMVSGLWAGGDRLLGLRWHPGSQALGEGGFTLNEVCTDTAETTELFGMPWAPWDVAETNDGRLWMLGVDLRDLAAPRHVLYRRGAGADPAEPVDLPAILGTAPRLSVTPPADTADLPIIIEDRRKEVLKAFDAGCGSAIPIDAIVTGTFPETHVVVRFHPVGEPTMTAALAIHLFTIDGNLIGPLSEFFDVGVLEALDTGGLDRLRRATPDDDGLVWLYPPRSFEGLQPRVDSL